MVIRLEKKDLTNTQQMEVAVQGPDGATHLIICTGLADLGFVRNESFTFLVGPKISRRQFVGAIASGALSTIQTSEHNPHENAMMTSLGAKFISIDTSFEDKAGQVQVRTEVASEFAIKLAISYNVNILAELTNY